MAYAINNRVICLLFAIVFFLLQRVTRIDADVVRVDISEIFLSADAVYVIQIVNEQQRTEQHEFCGTRYTGQILTRLKEFPPYLEKQTISFGRAQGIQQGKQYLLFLRYIADPASFAEETATRLNLHNEKPEEKAELLNIIECHGLVPGLIFNKDAAWEVAASGILVHNISPVMPQHVSIRINRAEEFFGWVINKDDLFDYFLTLATRKD